MNTESKTELDLQLISMNSEGPALQHSVPTGFPAWETKNSIPERIRVQMVGRMQERLAESIDLKLRAKNTHWNIKGHNFIAMHTLLDQIAKNAEGYSDLIAERIIQLGGTAQGTVAQVIRNSTLPEYPTGGVTTEVAHVTLMAQALASFSEGSRKVISQASHLFDPVTADIFTEISRQTDKDLWFIEAHYQKALSATHQLVAEVTV